MEEEQILITLIILLILQTPAHPVHPARLNRLTHLRKCPVHCQLQSPVHPAHPVHPDLPDLQAPAHQTQLRHLNPLRNLKMKDNPVAREEKKFPDPLMMTLLRNPALQVHLTQMHLQAPDPLDHQTLMHRPVHLIPMLHPDLPALLDLLIPMRLQVPDPMAHPDRPDRPDLLGLQTQMRLPALIHHPVHRQTLHPDPHPIHLPAHLKPKL
jgi:hypothetical protein